MKLGTSTRDMTSGPIAKQVLLFSIPMMLGNIFQLLYNTVDAIVVGNYVGKAALAAVGSTSPVINIAVFFFNGFSIGAGVVIARHFGAKDNERLHTAIETTMAATFIFCAVFTVLGMLLTTPLLHLMATPDDVIDGAREYLFIYFAGFSGLLIYNMGSGILRAVGDSTRPLLFLALTSVINIALDLLFVPVLHMGIRGVAYATILAQFVSAGLTLLLLCRTKEVYRLTRSDLRIDRGVLSGIFAIGMPTAIQSVVTTFSNLLVQGYVNVFGSTTIAAWSCFNKLEQYAQLPIMSFSNAATTFVSQNLGAKQSGRARYGIRVTLTMGLTIITAAVIIAFIFAAPAIALFNKDADVVSGGVAFVRSVMPFVILNCVGHTLAGALRGWGDSKAPMYAMLGCFVALRQLYLFIGTRVIANTPVVVGMGYPVGWVTCGVGLFIYYRMKMRREGIPER